MKRKIQIFTIILISLIFAAFIHCVPTFAYNKTTVTIPVATNEKMVIFIETADGEPVKLYQMNGEKALTLSFDEPGRYAYTARQMYFPKDDGTAFDDTVWYIEIAVMANESDNLETYLVISDSQTGQKVDTVMFANVHPSRPTPDDVIVPDIPNIPPEDSHTPRGGTASEIINVYRTYYESRWSLVRYISNSLLEEIADEKSPMASSPFSRPGDNPETGDAINLFSIFMLFACACACATMLMVILKTRKAKEKRESDL